MDHVKSTQGVYVDLDCLLDSRLGTLLNEGYSFEDIISNGYHERNSDSFFDLSIEDFKALYDKRDTDVLAQSKLTNLIFIIKNILKEYLSVLDASPVYNQIKLYVNVWPYKLDAYEEEQMVLSIKRWINYMVPIEVINISPEHLTTFWVNTHVDTMFKYDFHDWLTIQRHAFNRQQLTEVKLLGPALYHVKVPTEEEIQSAIKDIKTHTVSSLFEATEVLAMPLIDLNIIDVSHFSVMDPKTQYETYSVMPNH